MLNIFSAVECVGIAVHVRLVLVCRRGGIPIILSVILVINKEIRVIRVLYANGRIVHMPIGKWFSALLVRSKYIDFGLGNKD